MITKNEAAILLRLAMKQGMKYAGGKYQHHKYVTYRDDGYWVKPAGKNLDQVNFQHRYESVYWHDGTPEQLMGDQSAKQGNE